ncbi:hypothetical protein N5923_00550 [Erwiniaceae bacterium BAC15a-03b]|uniref:Uncharacterized protein n=1 Tax=Winslowiella arboricola TaxID=2978220 RepID=A0A9J6PHP8_9GAMM|nr:hypothetical protein [Winslowiella arboricola]MCU5771988.1 hypothetical protein [Winslowiella arboricola]MCU5775987.1 hypothetical protein [Winslowiella arboricola]
MPASLPPHSTLFTLSVAARLLLSLLPVVLLIAAISWATTPW